MSHTLCFGWHSTPALSALGVAHSSRIHFCALSLTLFCPCQFSAESLSLLSIFLILPPLWCTCLSLSLPLPKHKHTPEPACQAQHNTAHIFPLQSSSPLVANIFCLPRRRRCRRRLNCIPSSDSIEPKERHLTSILINTINVYRARTHTHTLQPFRNSPRRLRNPEHCFSIDRGNTHQDITTISSFHPSHSTAITPVSITSHVFFPFPFPFPIILSYPISQSIACTYHHYQQLSGVGVAFEVVCRR